MPGLLTFPPVADVRVPVAGGSTLLTHWQPVKKVKVLLFVVQRAVRCGMHLDKREGAEPPLPQAGGSG